MGDIHGRVCADTSVTRSIVGELMFNLLRERGVDFQKMEVTITLTDSSRTTMYAYTALVSIDIEGRTVSIDIVGRTMSIDIEGRTVSIDILALQKVKGNRTLLGTDFWKSLVMF
ncbi:hypothetical protein AVEN_140118-1 [Araneus ventricosus]|uniref:Uncharacterized protein n=1 Tax=Araneus ventricosus TaxID=182803 RepID=A0A4Y2LSI5_ARAVE|nr:hypothetical protein AVEN_140118-1 [Araneus ventricosus]